MDASVWVAKTGLTAQQRRMTVIATIWQTSTPLLKRDRAVFEDLCTRTSDSPALADAQTMRPRA